jgi:hypothetical protein
MTTANILISGCLPSRWRATFEGQGVTMQGVVFDDLVDPVVFSMTFWERIFALAVVPYPSAHVVECADGLGLATFLGGAGY